MTSDVYSRVIRKSQSQSSNDAGEMLGNLFAAELVRPSRTIWLVSPWISDVELLDNTAGGFEALRGFGRRRIRLAEILSALASAGTQVVVGTTPDSNNDAFLRRLSQLARNLLAQDRVKVVVDESGLLHTKALTADNYVVVGSMNLTKSGIALREEYVELRTDQSFVAQARMDAFERFGGVL